MTDHSPIVTLRDWFQSHPENVQHEIALSVAFLLFDADPAEIADQARCLRLVSGWLDDTIPRHRQLGRMLSFRACLDHMLSGRDTAEGWAVTEEMARRVLASGEGHAKTAETILAGLPERREQWIKIAADWYALRDRMFQGRHLDAWVFRG